MNLKPVSFNAIINQVIGEDENSHVINNTVAEDCNI